MHATRQTERYTVTPLHQTPRTSISFERAIDLPLSYPREAAAPAAQPRRGSWDEDAPPVSLRARTCQTLRHAGLLAVSVVGGGLVGWASYAVTTQAGGSKQDALGVGACVGSMVAACINASLLRLLENRHRDRVVTLPAVPVQTV